MAEEKLGKYELREVLGRGAMGTVYEAFDPIIERRVAIKTVRLPDAADTEAQDELARFRREAQAAGRLHHPNIVGVFDTGETAEIAYIVMEFVDGRTLKSVLDGGERFTVADIVTVMDGLLTGLAFSHERGVVHRDIKPANVILTAAGPLAAASVKIADFGIARIESSSMTQAGTVMGTPAYMSPEQFMGQTVDLRTDIYSSGVLLYQLLTGERPFEGSMTAIMHKALNTTPPRPSELSVTSPSSLDAVVARAMAKRPEDRFESAAAFMAALHEAAAAPHAPPPPREDDATIVATAPRLPPPPSAPSVVAPAARRGPLLVGGLLVGIAVVGGGAWFVLRPTTTAPPAAVVAPETKPVASAAAPATTAAAIPALPPVTAPAVPATPQAAPSAAPGPASSPSAVAPAAPAAAPPAAAPPAVVASTAAPIAAAAIARAVDAVPCALVGDAVGPGGIVLRGVAQRGAAEADLHRALADAAPAATVDWRVRPFSGDYCTALNILRGVAAKTLLPLDLATGEAVLHTDDYIDLQLTTPDYPAHLLLDYLSNDGSVVHMLPTDGRAYAAATHLTIGDRAQPKNLQFQVGEPYGTDMIVAVASSTPLFAEARPQVEPNAGAYFRALQAALDAASRRHTKIAVGALTLTTAASK